MIDYIVEANSFEHNMLYMMHHEDYTWKMATNGDGKNIGTLDNKPIFVSRLIDNINGKDILFWFATSTTIDYDVIDDWLLRTYPDALKVDANNFNRVLKDL